MMKKRGRPPKEPSDLITLDQALEAIREEIRRKYPHNEELVSRLAYSKGTLYNKSSLGQVHKWRKGKYVLFSKHEILKLVA